MTTVITGNTGEQVGTPTFTPANPLGVVAQTSVNSYAQALIQNSNNGSSASTDFIVNNDQGTDSTNYGDFGINSSGFSGSGPFSTAGGVYMYSQSSSLALGTYGAYPCTFSTNNTEAMRIDSSQNVGVGTTSPGSYSKFVVSGGNGNFISYLGSSTQTILGDNGGTLGQTGTVSNHPFIFLTNATERGRFDSSGNFLAGTTTAGLSALSGFNMAYASGQTYCTVGHVSGTSAGQPWLAFSYNGSTIGSVTQNGTTGTLYNITSDYRLKDNPTKINNGVATINQLNPVNFTWKPDGTADSGFLAHEFQEVLPRSVTGEKDAVDANGKPVYQAMDNSGAVPFLVAAIQELSATITTMQSQITDLQAKLKTAGVAGF